VQALRARSVLADIALALSVGALDVYLFSNVTGAAAHVAAGYAGAASMVLLARRRHPVAVFAVMCAYILLAPPVTGASFQPTAGPSLAMFTVAVSRTTATSVTALAVWEVLAVVGGVYEASTQPADNALNAFLATTIYNLLFYAGVWWVGRGVRASRLHAADLDFRRRVEAEQAVLAERTRIARELHDIVSHAVTVMVLQAAGAQRVLARDPDKARTSLHHIERLGEQAMGELRRMLTALRPSDEPALHPVTLTPAGLRVLFDAVSAAGVHVDLVVSGIARPLAPSVGLAAYRVVQEALTNVTKHAGPDARAVVRVTWLREQVEVAVCDDGQGGRPCRLSAGHGLRGLRERLAVAGGRLEAGPVAGGGFRVVARLPVAEEERVEVPG
jgi:signal transduction histidine kinase